MTRNSVSCLLLHTILLCCSYRGNAAADDDNAFTLVFGSELTLQDVQKEISDAKQTLTDALKSSSNLLEDHGSLVKRFDKLDTALSKQNDNLLKKLETFIEEKITLQSTELLQQLITDPNLLQEQMSAQQNSHFAELQMSENKLLDELKRKTTRNR